MDNRETRALEGQVAIVVGVSSGLGRATTIAFAGAGADVAALARDADELARVRTEVEAVGRRALAVLVDLAEDGGIADAVARMVETFGWVDVLVNATGTDVPGPVVDLACPGRPSGRTVRIRSAETRATSWHYTRHRKRCARSSSTPSTSRRGAATSCAKCCSWVPAPERGARLL